MLYVHGPGFRPCIGTIASEVLEPAMKCGVNSQFCGWYWLCYTLTPTLCWSSVKWTFSSAAASFGGVPGQSLKWDFFLFHFRFQVRSLCSAFQGCTVKCLYDICTDILSFCLSLAALSASGSQFFFSRISSALRIVFTGKIFRCINTLVIIIITWGLLIQANKQLSSMDIIRDRLSKSPSELSGFCSFGSFVLWSLKLSICGSPRCNLNGWQRVNYEVTLSIPQT